LAAVVVFPQVLANIGPRGETGYEFKTNCRLNSPILQTGFLWDLSEVVVTNPDGEKFHLTKDFNINNYSGEVTRRWVLYGPSDDSRLPESGIYTFDYIKDNKVLLTQYVDYTLTSYPEVENITVTQLGDSIHVTWTPPAGLDVLNGYKVFVSPVPNKLISIPLPWDASEVTFTNLTLVPGETYYIDVCLGGIGGGRCSEPVYIQWK